MIDSTVLMRRAVRLVCEQHNLSPEQIGTMTSVQQEVFRDLAIELVQDMQYNQLRYFRPFEHQKAFFATVSDRRGILAANRIGKTVSTC